MSALLQLLMRLPIPLPVLQPAQQLLLLQPIKHALHVLTRLLHYDMHLLL
jgi:hypothetical protein